MKHSFRNDYSELAHPRIMDALYKYISEQNEAYGLDYHCLNAERYIKETFGAESANVHFISGGTQTNLLFISFVLKPYEGVISSDTGHINIHETAAVESTGHKIITIKNSNGKINAEQIKQCLKYYGDNEHMVKPKMVYISNSTEIGTIYSKQELIDIYKVCKDNNLYFYIDGARLGSALTSKDNDVNYKDLGSLCDAFYIGGTKNGMLCGEALVINNKQLQSSFRYHLKNKGAMLAKSYFIGIQFEEAFKDGFYFELAKSTNEIANILKDGLQKLNINMLDSPTNQIFATFNKSFAELLAKEFGCEVWEEDNDTLTIRFVVSFLTTKDDAVSLLEFIKTHC